MTLMIWTCRLCGVQLCAGGPIPGAVRVAFGDDLQALLVGVARHRLREHPDGPAGVLHRELLAIMAARAAAGRWIR